MDTKEKVHNSVRQLLMQELGLTRELVREEATRIIQETIERHFNSEWLDRFEERAIDTIWKNLHKSRGGYISSSLADTITESIKKAAISEATRVFNDTIQITISKKEDSK